MATAEQVRFHYDLDTRFFLDFLDTQHRAYSCGVWDDASTLEEAQTHKMQRLALYARISPGQRVLDIGCGWGGMLAFAVEQLGAREAVGLTLSEGQYAYLQHVQLKDAEAHMCSWEHYTPTELFDAIVSIGAFEHFSSRTERANGLHLQRYQRFFSHCASWSRPGSWLALQTIVKTRTPGTRQEVLDTRFLLEHVFPGSALPTITDIQRAAAGTYEIRELRTIGPHYARTLSAWAQRLSGNTAAKDQYGAAIVSHYLSYFDAARRNFESGVTDLVQMSLCRLDGKGHPTVKADGFGEHS
jgi:cyclopropane-fatty-acyl-phospholipid synthase